ncbi:NUDIX domain-containing protein [Actinomadura keratinilytica]|uniref:NUDIX domain-containing protein n=1 Tax=Actinomadura keratinilytica TaxID=547461 RepID=UPI00361E0247
MSAVVRELREETGLRVAVGPLVGSVRRPGPGDVVYDIFDYLATPIGGGLAAGDDAGDVRWVTPEELLRLPTSPGLVEALTEWGVLAFPRTPPRPVDPFAGSGAAARDAP